ncbi:MAG: restriction endonuclease [Firmicutes bacterium]|nr:restriction endonuclease [Bacillota bacterium]
MKEWIAHEGYSRHLTAESLEKRIHSLESRILRSAPKSHSVPSENIADYLLTLQSQETRYQSLWDDCDTGADFEAWVADLFTRTGFSVERTPATRDHGADLLLSGMGVRVAVQVKFWTSAVGNHAVQEVVAAKALYKTDAAWVVTNSTFTEQAIVLAKANGVRLIEGNELKSMAKKK